jgi:lipopolysaccharide transport system ATP-binding protein
MQAIQSLCPSAIVLRQGQVKFSGPADMALSQYLDTAQKSNFIEFKYNKFQPSITFIKICKNELEKGNLLVEIGFKSPMPLNPPVGGVAISSSVGTPVFGTNPRFHQEGYGQPILSEGVLRLVAEKLPIYSGTYHLSAWLGDWQTDYDEKRDILSFDFKSGFLHPNAPSPEKIGFVDTSVQWTVV